MLLPRAAFAAPRPKPPGAIGALLLPLSGERAGLGASMARAASLALPGDAGAKLLPGYDTLGTPAGATTATHAAFRKGAPPLLLGPLTAGEVKPVLDAAGGVPVLTFSNDESLRGGGAFLLGITASQLVSAILQYARRRGVKRVALLAASDGWAMQCTAAARRTAAATGLDLVEVAAVAERAAPATIAALRGGGEAPDAVLLPDADQLGADLSAALREAGIQVLGLVQALDYGSGITGTLTGAWLAAPDPADFGDFSAQYESVNGSTPGLIAALAYDAATIAQAIAASGQPVRQALTSPAGFKGVTGALRFRTDGSASRSLAILTVGDGAYRTVDTSVGA